MNITPVRIYINGNGSISFYGPNNTLITNLQNLNGAKQSNGQIIFDGDDKTISFYVYQLTSIESATFSLPYSALDSRFFNPSVYAAKLNEVYQDICEYVLVNKNGGASFVGGVVAVYPNFASFPAIGQEAVIYIDESTSQAYFWDGTSYQLLVSTGVEQYASFALFPVTGSANVIYIDMSTFEAYVWDGAAYEPLAGGSGVVSWGDIIGTLSDQTDLQAALDDKVPYTGATANVDLGEYELKAGQLSLDTSPTGTASVGTTQWNNSTGISQTTLKGGSVVLKNGVDLVARVVNKVTPNTTLTKAAYQAVRVSGAAGQRLAIEFAQANNDNNSADTIGLVTETIPTNQEGFIMTVGNLEEINTTGSLQGETWADGDVLYLSPTTPGALTNIKPNGSTGHIVVMGYVEYAHAIHGKIYVKIMNGWELDELHNVYINSPTTWQVLRYNGTSQLWVNDSLTASILPGGIDASKIGAGTVDNTEFGYLDGVTSSIQTQLNAKQATLVSGTNIKTLEGQSLLGSGNIDLTKSDVGLSNVDNTSDLNKPVSTATQTALNAKQNTLTLTTTGTSGAATLVGSTLNIPQYSGGGGGGGGVHFNTKPFSGQVYGCQLTAAAGGGNQSTAANRMTLMPVIPKTTFTINNFVINVVTQGAGSLIKLLVYDDLNGYPSSKLYESTNLDCSTIGVKTVTANSFVFTANTTYWVGSISNSANGQFTGFSANGLLPLGALFPNSSQNIALMTTNFTFVTPPTGPIPTGVWSPINSGHIGVFIQPS